MINFHAFCFPPTICHHLWTGLSAFFLVYTKLLLHTKTQNAFLTCKYDCAMLLFGTCFAFDMMPFSHLNCTAEGLLLPCSLITSLGSSPRTSFLDLQVPIYFSLTKLVAVSHRDSQQIQSLLWGTHLQHFYTWKNEAARSIIRATYMRKHFFFFLP